MATPEEVDQVIDHIVMRRLVPLVVLPDWAERLRRRDVRDAVPVSRYIDDLDRPGSLEWDLGRIRFFVEEIDAGHPIDPVEIDNIVSHGRVAAEPDLLDGFHRFVASKIARAHTIPARYSGRVDLLDYLTGRTHQLPDD